MGGIDTKITDDALTWHMTRSGHFSFVKIEEIIKTAKPHDKSLAVNITTGRDGYMGWMGAGGSIFNWHPELEIGFGYVPFDLIIVDMANKRPARLQEIVVECVKGTYVEQARDEGGCSTCTTF